jgi:hypothetical protein
MIIAAPGSRSEGFTMMVFPVTVAMGIDQSGIMLSAIVVKSVAYQWQGTYTGKLNGAMLSKRVS